MYRRFLTLLLTGVLVVAIAAPTVLAAESHPSEAMVAAKTAGPSEEMVEPAAFPAVVAAAMLFAKAAQMGRLAAAGVGAIGAHEAAMRATGGPVTTPGGVGFGLRQPLCLVGLFGHAAHVGRSR